MSCLLQIFTGLLDNEGIIIIQAQRIQKKAKDINKQWKQCVLYVNISKYGVWERIYLI